MKIIKQFIACGQVLLTSPKLKINKLKNYKNGNKWVMLKNLNQKEKKLEK